MFISGLLLTVGFIVTASAQNIGTIAGGEVVGSLGQTGLQLLLQIIIGDSTTLRWRGLSLSLLSVPTILNTFVAAEIIQGVLPDWCAHSTTSYWFALT